LLLHDTTRGVVPVPIREHVRQVVRSYVPRDVLSLGTLAAVRVIRSCVHENDLDRFHADLLDGSEQFLASEESFRDLGTEAGRMNRAGRLEVAPDASFAGEHRARILSAAGDSLSCVFLHLRDSPAATSRIRPPPTAGVGGGAEAADAAE
jgi:hypothetical protein